MTEGRGNKDIEYLDKVFPKGDSKRKFAMVLLALARQEGRKQAIMHKKLQNL